MPEWKFSKDVYETVTEDISYSLHRYFAPVVGLINGVGKSFSADAEKKKLDQEQEDARARLM
jgi:hypothetical protein